MDLFWVLWCIALDRSWLHSHTLLGSILYWLTDFSYYRQKFRRLEAALIEYRESLEERGIKNVEEIEKKVALHRKRLEVEYGLSRSSDDVSGKSKS